jgi:hypothetical protein
VLSAINYCGYDTELNISDPLRNTIRAEVSQAAASLGDSAKTMCSYYSEHRQADSGRTLAQYVSLALYLDPPPALTLKVKEAELPPDAVGIIGIVPMLQNFYKQAGLHEIWQRHAAAYAELTERYHIALTKMMFDTEVYLKLPSSGYVGHSFTVYVDPMGAPGQTNARNYSSDYYIVISPGTGSSLKLDELRHTYLHYLLDPLAMKYPTSLKRLDPLMQAVKTAPLEESFKNDASLLVTECLIRAIEARIMGSKTPEAERQVVVESAMKQGYVLTGYFYNALIVFEKDPVGLKNSFGDLLSKIDVGGETKKAGQIQFAAKADTDILRLARPMEGKLLITAEQRLAAGDKESAQKLARQALTDKAEDQGRALFILAEVATVSKDLEGARNFFMQALDATKDPKVVAWSHIYLGRIFDLEEERETAVDHYRAALSAAASLPEAKKAAERGIEQGYEPPNQKKDESKN